MKKRFLTIPVLILLATVLSLLAACNKPEKTPEIPDIELDLSAYSVVRPSKASDAVVSAACGVRDLLRGYNKTAPITEDWLAPGTSPDDSAYEILIGTTNRPQSETALSAMTGDGARYVIAVIGNKIVINGSNDDAVIIGTEYFINNIASATSENGVLKLKENFSYTSEPLEMANLISDNKLTYKIVFAKDLDTTFKTSDTKDKTDYIVSKAYAIRDMFEKKLGAKPEVSDDWVAPGTATADLCEILVGTTDRDEYRAFLSELGYDEYGYAVKGNKVVIAGWNDTDIGYACDMFVSQIGSRIKTDDSGAKHLDLIGGTKSTKKNSERYTDFPAFEGGSLYGTYDAGYRNLEFYYTETTADAYRAYLGKLEGAGFEKKAENTIGGNLFATYTSDAGMLHVYFIEYEKAVRIISCPKGAYTPPAFEPEKTEKITEPKMTQMSLNYAAGNFGMCYIFTLEDGSFLLIDGGGTKGNDHVKLYRLLNELNERPDKKIVIAGWLLTHEHWDHFTLFNQFCKDYGANVTIEGFYYNTPAASSVYNANNPNYYISTGKLDEAMQAAGIKNKYTIHSGQKYYIRNAALTCLYTQEDSYPNLIHYFNETSMVTQIELGGQRIMILGDSNDKASDRMYRRYADVKVKNADGTERDFLACDIMQVAHHGYDGVKLNLYVKIHAPVAFWPTSEAEQKKQSSGNTSTYYYSADNYIANTLKALCLNAQKTHTVTLPFKVGDKVTDRD